MKKCTKPVFSNCAFLNESVKFWCHHHIFSIFLTSSSRPATPPEKNWFVIHLIYLHFEFSSMWVTTCIFLSFMVTLVSLHPSSLCVLQSVTCDWLGCVSLKKHSTNQKTGQFQVWDSGAASVTFTCKCLYIDHENRSVTLRKVHIWPL